jgi:hypothetical protein
MHQNVRKNGVVIVSNNAQSDTCSLPGKSPTFYITNQFCRVRYIERLLYFILFFGWVSIWHLKTENKNSESFVKAIPIIAEFQSNFCFSK